MILLTLDEVLSIHTKLIKKTGGTDGLRDKGLLESSLLSANASFSKIEQYPSIEEKSARLAYSLISNHSFIDGNKRIGVLVLLMTLKLNNVKLSYTQEELIFLGLSIADGSYKYDDIYQWILHHKT